MALGVGLRTAAWYGDQTLALKFPDNWEVKTMWPRTPPPLTDKEIIAALERPIGQPTIRESCRGKSRVLVIVDDLNRPTPAARIIPYVLRHFQDAGIPTRQVRILMAGGSHGAPGPDGMVKKVGPEAASCCRLLLHDPKRNTVKAGRTSYGTPVLVNQEVLASDFIVGIGGLYPNNTAGYGGGSKLALGVLDLRSISYLHHRHPSVGWASSQTDGDFRKDLSEVARMIGLTTSIAVHVSANREVVRLRCGDSHLFYPEEVAFAREAFRAPLPHDADVVVSNAYPNDLSFTFLWMKGLIPLRNCNPKASRIAIASCSEGLGFHGVYPVLNVPRFHEKVDMLKRISVTGYREIARKIARRVRRAATQDRRQDPQAQTQKEFTSSMPENPIWLYCPSSHANELPSSFRDMRVSKSWSEILREVEREQGSRGNINVSVYPCAPIQVLESQERATPEVPTRVGTSEDLQAR
jgi:lactate racemase